MSTQTPRLVPDRPSDYVLVPREPTEEMIDAAYVYDSGTPTAEERDNLKTDYRLMIAAAPPAEAPEIFSERHGVDLRSIKVGEVLTQAQWDAVCAFVREQEAIIESAKAEAPAERGALLAAVEEFFDRGEMDRDLDTPAERLLRNAMVRARDELGAAPAGAVALNAEYTRGRNDGWEAAKAAPAATAEVTGLREGNWHHPDGGRIVGWVIEPDDVARMKADAFCLPREVAEALETLRSAPRVTGGREDSELLDFMQNERVALIPEFEGGWDVEVFHDDGNVTCIGSGHTPRAALIAAIQAANGGEGS